MYLKSSKTIVIKIGSSLLIDKKKIRKKWLLEFSKDIKNLLNQNKKVIMLVLEPLRWGAKNYI